MKTSHPHLAKLMLYDGLIFKNNFYDTNKKY